MVHYPHIFLSSVLVLALSTYAYYYHTYGYFYKAVNQMFKGNVGTSFLWCFYISFGFVLVELLSLIFFGPRTAIDGYILYEKLWGACIDFILMIAMFRDILEPKYIVRLCFMLAMNYFHWMFEERVSNIERLSFVPLLYNFRIICVSFVLFTVDMFHIVNLFNSFSGRSTLFYLFSQQTLIMASHVIHDTINYTIILISKIKTDPMIYKMTYTQFFDFVFNFFRAGTYMMTCIMLIFGNTVPVFNFFPLLRYLGNALHSLSSFIQNIMFLNVIKKSALYLNEEEVSKLHDNTCIVCREEMVRARQLPCKHAFHNECLLYWAQSGRYCPVCREPITNLSVKEKRQAEPEPETNQVDGIEVDDSVINKSSDRTITYDESEIFKDDFIPKNLDADIPVFGFIPADYNDRSTTNQSDLNTIVSKILLSSCTKLRDDSIPIGERFKDAQAAMELAVGILEPPQYK